MAYNLRSRSIGDYLQQNEDEIYDFGDESSEDENDNVEMISETSCEESEFEIESDTENSLEQHRALQSRVRGRPRTVLRDRFTSTEVDMPALMNESLHCDKIFQFWEVLFTTEMRELIVKYTNIKIESTRRDITTKGGVLQTYHHLTDLTEINGFVGLLYYMGIWKVNHVAVKELWANTEGYTMFRSAMPGRRFIFLSQSLRFDDKSKRSPNKFACIEDLWNMFIDKCGRNYKPHKLCTVDEQLLSFRGRCSFRVYIKSKPDRYGHKLVTLNDATTFYMINAIPYTV
ncbi:piggyBac transposable element-derived protein 4-like [Prorops nasuta]|uniref:piggyBac transposable element-derived protein 4-like n=1 Tax=Prorops nasuta TaxID=863751 RepID=UPI0034CE61D7